MSDLLEYVTANLAARDNCPRHFFDYDELLAVGQEYDCAVCGARLNASYVTAYIQGYEAHGGDYRDIFPNYKTLYQMNNLHGEDDDNT